MHKKSIVTAIALSLLSFSSTILSQNLKYKGYGEINSALGMGTPQVAGVKVEPASFGAISTSHGVLIEDKFFVGDFRRLSFTVL